VARERVALGALRNRRAIAVATALEHWTYAHADLITAPTEGSWSGCA